MQNSFLIASALAMLSLTTPPTGWTAFTSRQAGFAVQMPATRIQREQHSSTVQGPFREWTVIGRDSTPRAGYMICYTLVPPAIATHTPSKAILSKMIQHMRFNVVSTRDISLQGFPGRELKVRVGADLDTVRVFVARRWAYTLMAMTPGGTGPTGGTARFLNSFHLLSAR